MYKELLFSYANIEKTSIAPCKLRKDRYSKLVGWMGKSENVVGTVTTVAILAITNSTTISHLFIILFSAIWIPHSHPYE